MMLLIIRLLLDIMLCHDSYLDQTSTKCKEISIYYIAGYFSRCEFLQFSLKNHFETFISADSKYYPYYQKTANKQVRAIPLKHTTQGGTPL